MLEENQELETQEEVVQEEVESQEETAPQQETHTDRNLRALREIKEQAERERDELRARLQQYEASNNRYAEPETSYDDDINVTDDDLVEGKHIRKVSNKIKQLEEQLYNYEQKSTVANAQARINATFPDFNKVVSKENIQILSVSYPELAATLNSGVDMYNTAASAYTIIKQLGIYKDDPYEKQKETAQKNAAKPRSSMDVTPQYGNNPLTHANAYAKGLTPELREQLRRESDEAISNY